MKMIFFYKKQITMLNRVLLIMLFNISLFFAQDVFSFDFKNLNWEEGNFGYKLLFDQSKAKLYLIKFSVEFNTNVSMCMQKFNLKQYVEYSSKQSKKLDVSKDEGIKLLDYIIDHQNQRLFCVFKNGKILEINLLKNTVEIFINLTEIFLNLIEVNKAWFFVDEKSYERNTIPFLAINVKLKSCKDKDKYKNCVDKKNCIKCKNNKDNKEKKLALNDNKSKLLSKYMIINLLNPNESIKTLKSHAGEIIYKPSFYVRKVLKKSVSYIWLWLKADNKLKVSLKEVFANNDIDLQNIERFININENIEKIVSLDLSNNGFLDSFLILLKCNCLRLLDVEKLLNIENFLQFNIGNGNTKLLKNILNLTNAQMLKFVPVKLSSSNDLKMLYSYVVNQNFYLAYNNKIIFKDRILYEFFLRGEHIILLAQDLSDVKVLNLITKKNIKFKLKNFSLQNLSIIDSQNFFVTNLKQLKKDINSSCFDNVEQHFCNKNLDDIVLLWDNKNSQYMILAYINNKFKLLSLKIDDSKFRLLSSW